MIDVIVDTGVIIDVIHRRTTRASAAFARLVDHNVAIGITDIILAELRSGSLPSGVDKDLDYLMAEERVARLRHLDDFERAAGCRRACAEAGSRVRSLADCLIASVCIRDGIPLLHDDRDFNALAGCTDLQVLPL